jgi:UDP-glucuronate decarboxylase
MIIGLMRMMDSAEDVTGPINLGNPAELTILEIAQMVIELVGSRSKIVHLPLPEDDPRQRRPDISAAERTLDWHPGIPLDEGLPKTIAYFEKVVAEGKLA